MSREDAIYVCLNKTHYLELVADLRMGRITLEEFNSLAIELEDEELREYENDIYEDRPSQEGKEEFLGELLDELEYV